MADRRFTVILAEEDAGKLDELVSRERARDDVDGATVRVGPVETMRRLIRRAHDAREFARKTGKHA